MAKTAELIKGFQQVSYKELQKNLNTAFENSKETLAYLAYNIGVSSTATAQNALNADRQVVSDQVLTKVLNLLSVKGMVVWVNGERHYYIKN